MRPTVLALITAVFVIAAGLGRDAEALAQDRRVVRDLPAIPGVYALSLLTLKEVRDELKLSTEQVRNAHEAYEKYQNADALLPVSPADERDKAEAGKRWRELQAESQKAVAAILTPSQLKRFRQIRLQQVGAVALADPTLADELKLTEDQRKAVQAIVADRQAKARAAGADPARTNREVAAKTAELTRAADAEVRKRLTADQRTKWDELLGQPFRWPMP